MWGDDGRWAEKQMKEVKGAEGKGVGERREEKDKEKKKKKVVNRKQR